MYTSHIRITRDSIQKYGPLKKTFNPLYKQGPHRCTKKNIDKKANLYINKINIYPFKHYLPLLPYNSHKR